jgi:flagellin
MAISIKTNVIALTAQRTFGHSQDAVSRNISRLASGMRINRAADDPAGLAVSEKFTADVRSFNQAHRNANDAISLLNTAEGALDELGDILVRMRELAVESANDTLTDSERTYLQDEFAELRREIDRISAVTRFNDRALLDGTHSDTAIDFQVGIDDTSDSRLSITLSNVGTESIGSSASNLSSATVANKLGATSALAIIDESIVDINTLRSKIGSYQSRLQSAAANLAIASENASSALSRIRDVDVAAETAAFTQNQILVQAGAAVLAQANAAPSVALQLIG